MSGGENCARCQAPNPEKKCSRCRVAGYCNAECQNAHWREHRASCIPESVQGIVIRCEGERKPGGPFAVTQVPRTHPLHTSGLRPPLPKKVGVPLIVYRHPIDPGTPRGPRLDNQIATYLMIDLRTGFAPPEFQQQAGTVTVIRADYKPLTMTEIETIWMYHDHILDLFGDGPQVAHSAMTKERFQSFCQRYKEECLMNNRKEFEDLKLPI
ncbi:hypothetical protein CC1G_04490 [Coprinopsis cinerea okayama7|uniref:MYND-type domain-containing protein n=1 Tax=Coprinopsis cinerea (strain Okayama-7 / 130 / ATCC MYA-4618 / FGSC 9003) TaxID=240176 RepID=A8N5B2_COPC7|nr:hypothetical protein CC1G_04490 [Coprinopsis cinerea okayama7\|eukprot:XP_001830057.2 hypothetical protein CC1G_04490 [Coprinopsis cinerea okayama7\